MRDSYDYDIVHDNGNYDERDDDTTDAAQR